MRSAAATTSTAAAATRTRIVCARSSATPRRGAVRSASDQSERTRPVSSSTLAPKRTRSTAPATSDDGEEPEPEDDEIELVGGDPGFALDREAVDALAERLVRDEAQPGGADGAERQADDRDEPQEPRASRRGSDTADRGLRRRLHARDTVSGRSERHGAPPTGAGVRCSYGVYSSPPTRRRRSRHRTGALVDPPAARSRRRSRCCRSLGRTNSIQSPCLFVYDVPVFAGWASTSGPYAVPLARNSCHDQSGASAFGSRSRASP